MLWASCAMSLFAMIPPESVAILYNTKTPESAKLAETYREARHIPKENLIGLEMPEASDISREDFEKKILQPLRAEFDKRGLWKRQKDISGMIGPVSNKIHVLVLMKGTPLRIAPQAIAKPKNHPVDDHNEASVDSELAMFGIEGMHINGVLKNKFFQSEKSIMDVNLPFLTLTARIDAASWTTCERMIRDAIETEKTGLWGRAYVDVANKFPEGDRWLEGIVQANTKAGIPTVVDRFNETLPKNYPMTDPSLYYGWYDWNVSGPFLNPKFKFRQGAVALHIHSFSAEQLIDANKNWSAPLLERGAAVTVGNVYEPYLGITHHFDIVHQRLLDGFTWVEACWAGMPATSWQSVTLGDPLYRPFLHLSGTGEKQDDDIPYRALRAAAMQWAKEPGERMKQVQQAANRMQSGILAEAVGLHSLEEKNNALAVQWFGIAKSYYPKPEDKLRQDMHVAAVDRAKNRPELATQSLQSALARYGGLPEAEALTSWLGTLQPPKVEKK